MKLEDILTDEIKEKLQSLTKGKEKQTTKEKKKK